jgi:hypothetical protein
MRFFVANSAPRMTAGFLVREQSSWRFALGASVARAASEKRWQSHRTPKVLGGGLVAWVRWCAL